METYGIALLFRADTDKLQELCQYMPYGTWIVVDWQPSDCRIET
jgi:hypothetical protein